MKNEYVNKIIKVILAFLLFFYGSFILVPIFKYIIPLDFVNDYNKSFVTFDLAYEVFVAIIAMIIYCKVLKIDIKKTKETIKKSGIFGFFKIILTGYILCMLMSILASNVETILGTIFKVKVTTSNNQSIIETLLKKYPIMMIASSCIFAPIVEEIIFRCGIRQVIKDKRVFITVSGLIFGLMHVTDNITLLLEILIVGIVLNLILEGNKENKVALSVTAIVSILVIFTGIYAIEFLNVPGNIFAVIKGIDPKEIIVSISYIMMGVMLALIYTKYDDIHTNILIHAFHNTVSTILILSLI